jgi:hypothetical protein
MRGRLAVIFWFFLIGCGYPTYRYVDEEPVPDGSTEQPDVEPPRDACVENGCGGCNDRGTKGLRCEPCGQWTCSGTNVVCTPAMPAPGAACGICGTQTRTCTSLGTTACPMEDDRLVYEDAAFKSKDAKQWVVDRSNEALIAFKSVRALSYFDVNLVLRRVPYVCAHVDALPHPDSACSDCRASSGGGFDCTVPAPTIDEVNVTLYAGSPSTGLTPLTTSSIIATSVATTAGFIAFTLAAPVSPRPVGTPLAIGVTTASSGHAFEIYGGGSGSFPPAATDTVFWHRSTKPIGAWIEEPNNDLAHVLRGKACAP